ncbi:hypothetical protein [Loktanella sp. M215]|uniref:hypothetical protein n=1 Tax=Loktanella sp. M215 TaxID=2675431 RepID=UPI001F3BD5EA|nr:hypothetical protein [Loktanella sp. M215]MCF7701731.1 phosphonate transporter [Loktanella sp. M215]
MNEARYGFETVSIADLEILDSTTLDALPFGVIGMRRDTVADVYNATEAQLAGLLPQSVLGAPFFDNIAQCMNNYMVAQRFEDEPHLDNIIPFVLTLRMRPTPVRLRLLQAPQIARRYMLIER